MVSLWLGPGQDLLGILESSMNFWYLLCCCVSRHPELRGKWLSEAPPSASFVATLLSLAEVPFSSLTQMSEKYCSLPSCVQFTLSLLVPFRSFGYLRVSCSPGRSQPSLLSKMTLSS